MRSALVLMLILLIGGCGASSTEVSSGNSTGSSTGSSTGGTAPPAQVAKSNGGIWRGQVTTASGASVQTLMIVSEDGSYISVAQDAADHCADVAQGALDIRGTSVAGQGDFGRIDFTTSPAAQVDCKYADGSEWGTSAVSGTIAPGSSLTVTSTDTTSMGTALAASPAALAFDALYNESSDLGKTAGSWTAQTGAVFSIDSGGAISALDPQTGCTLQGELSLINALYDVYSVTVTYSDCAPTSADLNGITALGLVALDDKVSPNELYMGYGMTLPNGDSSMFASVATR